MTEPATEHGHSHGNIGSELKSKAGPLPVWVWGVLIGGVLVGYMYWHKSRTATAPTSVDVSGTGVDDALSTGDAGTTTAGSVGTPSEATTSGLSSNQTWEAQALTQLTGSGATPLAAQQALENYLSGASLSGDEQTLINQALGSLGLPPEGVSGPVNTTQPTPEVVVADQADLQQALSAGIPSTWLRAAPSDPKSGLVAVDPAYAPVSGLPAPSNPLAALWLGVAGTLAPSGAPTAVGATRVQTGQLASQWFQLQKKS